MRTQVGIVGAGPAGLALAHLLDANGIACVVLEARDRASVESRIRAGLLEANTVALLERIGVADRLRREGQAHDGFLVRFGGRTERVPVAELGGRGNTVYGQQEIVKDLIASWLARGGELRFEAKATTIEGLDGRRPRISYEHDGEHHGLECDYVAGCDGFHGPSRQAIPADAVRCYDQRHPFAWLGILADVAPTTRELIYAWHPHGFALYSMRSAQVSRLYLQVPHDDVLDDWSDDRIWSELQLRLAADGTAVGEGPIRERSLTLMRSFVCEPMQHGRLFLAGDAAHIVPPTAAKGLNLAINDVRLLADAFGSHYRDGDDAALASYSARALRRVWLAQGFSNEIIELLHALGDGPFHERVQLANLEHLFSSDAALRNLAEHYAGFPPTDEL